MLRLAPSSLYNSFEDCFEAVQRLVKVAQSASP
jgi:kynureninase